MLRLATPSLALYKPPLTLVLGGMHKEPQTSGVDEYSITYRYWVLIEALFKEPSKVAAIVKAEPQLLENTSVVEETPLHFLAIEGNNDSIRLLRSLGAKIPEEAVYHAIEAGHTDTVILLLELGANPVREQCERSLAIKFYQPTDKHKRLVRSYLDQFGYKKIQ